MYDDKRGEDLIYVTIRDIAIGEELLTYHEACRRNYDIWWPEHQPVQYWIHYERESFRRDSYPTLRDVALGSQ